MVPVLKYQIYYYIFTIEIRYMAKDVKKPSKSMLLRLWRPKLFEAIKKEAEKNKRPVNSEIEYTLEQKYL